MMSRIKQPIGPEIQSSVTPLTTPAKNANGGHSPETEPANEALDESALEGGPEPVAASPYPDLEAALGLKDEGMETVEILVDVACRKPKPTEFFRTHPDPAMSRTAYVFTDREEIGGETYFVMPAARACIAEHLRPVLLVTCINRQNITFLWPIAIPDPNSNSGRQNRWGSSALQAMKSAQATWTKMTAGQGAYRVFKAEKQDLPEPQWPDRSFLELLATAFKDTLISDEKHPMVQRLRGLR